MNKTIAHIILSLIDVAALFACYYVYSEYREITNQLHESVDKVMIQKPLGLYAVLIVMPVLHGISIFKITKNRAKLANNSFIVFFILLVASAFIFDSRLDKKITQSGYYYCDELSESMRMSQFRTYIKEGMACINKN